MRKGSRKEHQEEPSKERQEGSLKGKDGKRRGAETLERSPGYLAGLGGGGAPMLGGTRRDPGEGRGTEQHKDRKKLVEGPMKDMKENHSRSKEPESHRKDPKKERRQIEPEKVGKERKPQSPGHPGPLGKLQDNAGDCPGQQELARIRTTWRIGRLSGRGQGGGQKWEVLDRAAARGRGRIAGTMADVVDKAPQSIIGRSALPGKKEFAGN